jgi:hypothetical protein
VCVYKVCLCVCINLFFTSLNLCIYVSECLCVCVFMCVCVSVCLCVCVFVCLCVYVSVSLKCDSKIVGLMSSGNTMVKEKKK